MSKHKAIEYEDYLNLQRSQLFYTVDQCSIERNKESFDSMCQILNKAGIIIDIAEYKDGKQKKNALTIKVDPERYLENQRRFAGAKVKGYKFTDNEIGLKGDAVCYSDVIFMLQSHTDKEVMEKLGIKYATYYRHKKKMLDSDYYMAADKNRLDDEDYLKGEELGVYDFWF